MTKLQNVAKALIEPINPSAIILLGAMTIFWGLWMIAPWWTVYGTGLQYAYMSQIPEVVWGGIAVVCGLGTSIGAIKGLYKPVLAGASIAFLHWTMITILFMAGSLVSPEWIFTLTFAVYAAYIRINVS